MFWTIIKLEGLWVKAGQYMSSRADIMPQEYLTVLAKCQDRLPPRPLAEIDATILKELGSERTDLFLHFDTSPLGSASIAQGASRGDTRW
jgi:aarF domain-containing kinase